MSLSYGLSSKTMESASASSLQNPDFNSDYLLIFFDINRGGFFDVAQKILQFLDYKSLVMFKRTCKSVYEFLSANCDIEKVSKEFFKKFRQIKPVVSVVWHNPKIIDEKYLTHIKMSLKLSNFPSKFLHQNRNNFFTVLPLN